MTDRSTSLAAANSARAEWRRFFAFVRRPELPATAGGFGAANFVAVLRMLALDQLAMLGLIVLAGTVVAIGVDLPETALAKLEWTPLIVFMIVVGAPLFEEIALRSWLSGRPGHVLAVLLLATPVMLTAGQAEPSLAVALASLAALLAALAALFVLRKRAAMSWFARAFPLFYWASTVGFALLHLYNFEEGALAVLLPLVIPQFVLGSILGYVRVLYGLWASILLHVAHNGIIVALVSLAVALGG